MEANIKQVKTFFKSHKDKIFTVLLVGLGLAVGAYVATAKEQPRWTR